MLAARPSAKLEVVASPDLDLTPLRSCLEALAPVEAPDWEELRPRVRARRVARGAYLQRAGEPVVEVAFLLDGVVREYYTTDDGREHIKGFVRAGRFALAYADRILERPSSVWIQALVDTRVLVFPAAAFEELRRRRPVWEVVTRRLLEELYVRKERRELEFLTLAAGERYQRLLEDQPGIEAVVTQAHLASYLGITPIALSRIRARRRLRG